VSQVPADLVLNAFERLSAKPPAPESKRAARAARKRQASQAHDAFKGIPIRSI
jgi:hypothetical protein